MIRTCNSTIRKYCAYLIHKLNILTDSELDDEYDAESDKNDPQG
jgi:hypothetical protein